MEKIKIKRDYIYVGIIALLLIVGAFGGNKIYKMIGELKVNEAELKGKIELLEQSVDNAQVVITELSVDKDSAVAVSNRYKEQYEKTKGDLAKEQEKVDKLTSVQLQKFFDDRYANTIQRSVELDSIQAQKAAKDIVERDNLYAQVKYLELRNDALTEALNASDLIINQKDKQIESLRGIVAINNDLNSQKDEVIKKLSKKLNGQKFLTGLTGTVGVVAVVAALVLL